MRTAVFFLSLALAAAPAMAGRAQSDDVKAPPAPKVKLPASLRGPLSAQVPLGAAPATPRAAPSNGTAIATAITRNSGAPAKRLPTAPPPLASPIASAKPAPDQCRTACAHVYYFCPSGPSVTDCASSWGQCLSDCSFPPLTIPR